MNKYIYIIFSLLLMAGSGHAQSKKAYRKAAENAFEKGDFPAAFSFYKILIENTDDSTNVDVLNRAAHAARQMYFYEEAEVLYSKILEIPEAGSKLEAKFFMGISKFHQMDYAQAISIFKEVESETEDLSLKNKVQKASETAEWALEQMVSGTAIQINRYGPEVNSPFVDVAPYWYDGALHFTTVRGFDSTMHVDDFEGVTRIYKLKDDESEEVLISGNPTDKKIHSANFVVNNEGNRKYINYCTQINNENFHCKLFYYETKPDGSEEFISMPNYVNNDTFTTSEPAVGLDESGNEVVYFVSDRPGGMGGLDIWYVTRSLEGNWSQPQNLSALNTSEDDITPFFHLPTKTMFFSSNGREGMGNFDIYKSTWRVDEWTAPIHTGFPINSGYDDTYFSFNSERALGTFVSNRPGCMCHSEENNCKCNDIYSYEIKVDVDLLVFNKYNETEIAGATVQLIDTETGEVITVSDNFDGNDFNFPLGLEKTYRLIASKDGWVSDSIEFNTRGIFLPTSIEQKLYLEPSVKLEVLVFDALTRLPVQGATIGFTEEGGAGTLEKTNETGNDFYYDLTFGKNYRLLASKEGYDEGQASASTIELSSPQIIKREIYLNPFAGELVLYFDNDYPKYPRNPINTDTTLSGYGETFEAYYAKKELFVEEYSKGRSEDQKQILDASMRDFFESEIKGNYEKLNEYCRLLELYLSNNPSKKLEVLIEGFASPLAGTEYNRHLTNRRIVCVINHFRNYEGGVLMQYIEGDLPQLFFTRISNGETASAPVDDNKANPRESIFSRKASIERRVQISEIREYLPGMSSLNQRIIRSSGGKK